MTGWRRTRVIVRAYAGHRIHGVWPFKGYRVTCLTNEEEEAVGLASRATWLLESELKRQGRRQRQPRRDLSPYMVEDRNLVDQNLHSAPVIGKRLLEVLG
jgi:hypothetical protein